MSLANEPDLIARALGRPPWQWALMLAALVVWLGLLPAMGPLTADPRRRDLFYMLLGWMGLAVVLSAVALAPKWPGLSHRFTLGGLMTLIAFIAVLLAGWPLGLVEPLGIGGGMLWTLAHLSRVRRSRALVCVILTFVAAAVVWGL